MSRITSRWLLVVVVCCLPVALAACGSSDSGSTGTTAAGTTSTAAPAADIAADPEVVALVPEAIRAKGSITVATDPTYAPNEFIDTDGKTIVGTDVDLAHAIAATMGIEANVVSGTFDGLIPGLAAHKYDVGMASFGDTRERERTVDFVTYLSAGSGFYTRAAGGTDIDTLADLCGHSIAVQKGTTQADDVAAQDEKCRAAGKPGVDANVLTEQTNANLAVSAGRVELGLVDALVADYVVAKSNNAFKRVGTDYGAAPYGIAIPKDAGLAEPMLAAVKSLMASGAYRAILARWGVEGGGITDPKINGAIS